jgi:hypothetical protein
MSVAANIAEGSGQVSAAQFARYLAIALGSARELDYHVLVAKDLGLLPPSDYARLDARVDQVCNMLAVLRLRVLQQGGHATRRIRSDQVRAGYPTSDFRHPPSD